MAIDIKNLVSHLFTCRERHWSHEECNKGAHKFGVRLVALCALLPAPPRQAWCSPAWQLPTGIIIPLPGVSIITCQHIHHQSHHTPTPHVLSLLSCPVSSILKIFKELFQN